MCPQSDLFFLWHLEFFKHISITMVVDDQTCDLFSPRSQMILLDYGFISIIESILELA